MILFSFYEIIFILTCLLLAARAFDRNIGFSELADAVDGIQLLVVMSIFPERPLWDGPRVT